MKNTYTFMSAWKDGFYREDRYVNPSAGKDGGRGLLKCLLYMDSVWTPKYNFRDSAKFYVIDFVVSGVLELRYGTETHRIPRGGFSVLKETPVVEKRAVGPGPLVRKSVLLPADGFNRTVMEALFPEETAVSEFSDPEAAEAIFAKLKKLVSGRRDAPERISTVLFELIQTAAENMRRKILPEALARALRHYRAHSERSVFLPELAKEARVSEKTLLRLFRREFGTTPAEYMIRERIARAEILLAAGCAGVKETSARCGFCNQAFFTRTFRKHTGKTPSEFIRSRRTP